MHSVNNVFNVYHVYNVSPNEEKKAKHNNVILLSLVLPECLKNYK